MHERTTTLVAPVGRVLDLDSKVFERYGQQEGSLQGHHPKKHGRPSPHPLLAMLAEAKVVVNAWLRSGNAGTARGAQAFLAETLARWPAGFRIYALRADSGFFIAEFLDELEARRWPYAIVVRMTQIVQREVVGLRDGTAFAPGLAVAEFPYQAPSWKAHRRVVGVREEIRERPAARGRRLFEVPGYTFHAIVTTLPHPPADVGRFYNSRADGENRRKELQDDFKRDGTGDESPRRMTLRSQLFVVGGILGASGHPRILRRGLRGRWRVHFATILERVASCRCPTVAPLDLRELCRDLMPPRPWRLRRPRPQPTARSWLLSMVN
jgi:hypothetical protein